MRSGRGLLATLFSASTLMALTPLPSVAADQVIKVGTLKLIHGITPPGSTQEVVFLDRLKQEGMTIKDVQSVRVSFSEMASALERGDIDAFVGAEPGPSISVGKGVGKVVEYPYTNPTGSVNMVMTAHADTLRDKADLVKVFLEIHRKATEYAMSDRAAFVAMSSQKLGIPANVVDIAAPNVELTWKLDDDWVTRARYYGSQMLDKKQIRQLPDYAVFIQPTLVRQLASR